MGKIIKEAILNIRPVAPLNIRLSRDDDENLGDDVPLLEEIEAPNPSTDNEQSIPQAPRAPRRSMAARAGKKFFVLLKMSFEIHEIS